MKKLFVLALTGAILYSCSNLKPKTETTVEPTQQNAIVITNDMENASAAIPSWFSEKTVIAMNSPAAHTGKYACITNDTCEFSYTYQEVVKNINTGIPKSVTVTGWVNSTVVKPTFGIILDVSQNSKLYDWKTFPLTDSLTETGKWIEFNASFYFDKPINPEQTIKLYAWNQSKKTVYIDDLRISFNY